MPYAMTESADERNLPMCKEIAEYLAHAYPGYTWYVRIDGGMLVIKNFSISNVWSMCVPYHVIAHDAMVRKREVVMKAGEFLECANLRRGCATPGEFAKALEGRKDAKAFRPMSATARSTQ